jgi:hypothetical protein
VAQCRDRCVHDACAEGLSRKRCGPCAGFLTPGGAADVGWTFCLPLNDSLNARAGFSLQGDWLAGAVVSDVGAMPRIRHNTMLAGPRAPPQTGVSDDWIYD